jgi:hypothetical protein
MSDRYKYTWQDVVCLCGHKADKHIAFKDERIDTNPNRYVYERCSGFDSSSESFSLCECTYTNLDVILNTLLNAAESDES